MGNEHLEEMYLTGNPCTSIEGYRMFVVALLPQLQQLDGEDVKPSERTEARQQFSRIKRLVEHIAAEEELLPEPVSESDSEDEVEPEPEPSKFEGFGKTATVKAPTPSINKAADGRVRQCNQGGYKFSIDETDEEVIVEVGVSKFLDTSLIDTDIHPDFVRVTIKGKVLQLVLPCEIRTDTASCQRSNTTGALMLRCPRVHPILRHKHKLVGVAPDPQEDNADGMACVGGQPAKAGNKAADYTSITKDSPAGLGELQFSEQQAYVDKDFDDDAPPEF